MAEFQNGNGSFQSQTQSPSSSRATRRSSAVVWEALKQKRAQRGSPKAASLSRLWQDSHKKSQDLIRTSGKCCQRTRIIIGVHAEHFRYRSQDASFAIVLHGGGGRKISYECPEYGQKNVSS